MSINWMVALGSSFAAGPGIAPVADAAAMRSKNNYPQLVAAKLGAALIDASVSGATTNTILRTHQRRGRRRFPPQIESVDPRLRIELVTITAGGNDFGYLESLVRAASANRLTGRAISAPLGRRLRRGGSAYRSDQVDRTADGLVAIVNAVAERAPLARVLLVDYLTIIGPRTLASHTVPFSQNELDRFRDTADRLAAAFRSAEQRSVAELVPVSKLSSSHSFDAAEPWVNGLQLQFPFRRLGSSFHPNPAGMQAVSQAVLRHLRTT